MNAHLVITDEGRPFSRIIVRINIHTYTHARTHPPTRTHLITLGKFLRQNKPTDGPYRTVAKLQTAFEMDDSPSITRKDFHVVFAREKANGLAVGLFEIDW